LTEANGEPFVGSTVVTVYDKSVEYISGGSNVPDIKDYFWKWRRHHHPQIETNVNHYYYNLLRRGERPMNNLGIFGATVVEEERANMMLEGVKADVGGDMFGAAKGGFGGGLGGFAGGVPAPMAPMAAAPGMPANAQFRQNARG